MKAVARFTLIVLVLPAILFGQGSGPRPPDLPILVQRAPLIVDATVQSASPNRGGPPNSVRQDVVFSINRVLKGTPPPGNRVLLIHLAGGQGPGTIPLLTGERYILFLQPAVVIGEDKGPPEYRSMSPDNAVKIDGGKLVVNSAMPFSGTHNGKGVDEFVRELQTLIKP